MFSQGRLVRLGMPFLLVVFLLTPLLYYVPYSLTFPQGTLSEFFSRWLAVGFWRGGQGWFLALLLVFDVIARLLYKTISSPRVNACSANANSVNHAPLRIFAGVVLLSFIAYAPMAYGFGTLHWVTFGPFQFQSSRVFLYLTYFFVGVAIGAHGVEGRLMAPDGKLAKRWGVWLAVALILFSGYIGIVMKTGDPYVKPSAGHVLLLSLSFTLSCAASSFLLLALFSRFVNRRLAVFDNLSAKAYGIFIVHYVFVVWIQFALLGVRTFAIAKGVIATVGAVLLSWATSAFFQLLAKRFVPQPLDTQSAIPN
jgi:Acyltransferase family